MPFNLVPLCGFVTNGFSWEALFFPSLHLFFRYLAPRQMAVTSHHYKMFGEDYVVLFLRQRLKQLLILLTLHIHYAHGTESPKWCHISQCLCAWRTSFLHISSEAIQSPLCDDPLCHWLVCLQVGGAEGHQERGNTWGNQQSGNTWGNQQSGNTWASCVPVLQKKMIRHLWVEFFCFPNPLSVKRCFAFKIRCERLRTRLLNAM